MHIPLANVAVWNNPKDLFLRHKELVGRVLQVGHRLYLIDVVPQVVA